MGLLLERDPDPRLVRMYIVAAENDQAVVAIERIEDRPEPDVDRSLALKVRDAFFVIEQVTEHPKTPLAAVVAPVPSPAPPAPEPAPGVAEPPLAGPRYEVWLDVGGGLSLGSGARALFAGALGLSRVRERLRLELGVGARSLAEHHETEGGARVSEVQRGPVLSLRALHQGERFAIGAALDPALLVSRALGSAPNGEQGEQRKLVFGLSLALDLRVRLASSVALRFAPALEWLSPRQRYAVDEQVVTDLGRLHVLVPLSLFVGLPVGGAR